MMNKLFITIYDSYTHCIIILVIPLYIPHQKISLFKIHHKQNCVLSRSTHTYFTITERCPNDSKFGVLLKMLETVNQSSVFDVFFYVFLLNKLLANCAISRCIYHVKINLKLMIIFIFIFFFLVFNATKLSSDSIKY